jgi:hypothetical protein
VEEVMSEGKFDAALRILKGWIAMPEPDMTQIQDAIALLEAAGKMDKRRAETFMRVGLVRFCKSETCDHWNEVGPCNPCKEQQEHLLALLEALPEPPEGGRG